MTDQLYIKSKRLKFLKPYTRDEEFLFPGRSLEYETAKLIKEQRLVILHGPAGCGKTSYLQAQVVPELLRAGYKAVNVRIKGDPHQSLKASLYGISPGKMDAIAAQKPLIQIVADTRADDNKPLVIVFDQFEEFLSQYTTDMVSNFLETISRVIYPLANPDKPLAHIAISVRSDFFSKLQEVSPIPFKFDSAAICILPHLNTEEINRTLKKFSGETGIFLERSLITAIKKDIAKIALRTIDFQILLHKLYLDHFGYTNKNPGLDKLSPLTISLARYKELGGAAKIVRNFLEAEIESILTKVQEQNNLQQSRPGAKVTSQVYSIRSASKLRRGIRSLLTMLVSKQQVSTPTSRQAIIYQLLSENIGLNRIEIHRLIFSLSSHGIIRRLINLEATYELTHGVLAQMIWRWIETSPGALKRIEDQDKARKILNECEAEHRTLSIDELIAIKPFVNYLGFGAIELSKIFRSSLLRNTHSDVWNIRLRDEGISTEKIILDTLHQIDFLVRNVLIKSLYKIGSSAVQFLTGFLDDDYPQVRATAIAALIHLDPTLEWHRYLTRECFVPGSNFPIGTNQGTFSDEGPEHQLSLPDFYICKSPVTNLEYQKFADDVNIPFSFPLGMERHPVVNITWFEAREYARWGNLRLASEPEWEKAASLFIDKNNHILKLKYPWGNEFDETRCNTQANKINGTTRVGSYSLFQGDSACGCTDMAGNVWEWTSTIFKPYPYRNDDGREDPSGVGSRVLRGGSYKSGASYVTCTARQPFDPYSKRGDVGFRCLIDLPDVNLW
jgi:hypothetical protein